MISRTGRLKKRLYPWFEPPAAGLPRRYAGWVWDPAEKEWVHAAVEAVTITLDVPKYPMPSHLPRPAQPLYVEGWYWNGRAGVWEETTMPFEDVLVFPERGPMPEAVPSRAQPAEVPGWRFSFTNLVWEEIPMVPYTEMQEKDRGPMPKYIPGPERPSEVEGWSWFADEFKWVATIVMAEKVGFTPPRSLPPEVDEAMIFATVPLVEQYQHMYDNLIKSGLEPHQARKVATIAGEYMIALMKAKYPELAAKPWSGVTREVAAAQQVMLQEYKLIGLLYLVAAITGALIGTILRRLAIPDEDFVQIGGGDNVYLLGPDNWLYSREVATSSSGRRYFSACDGIGAGYSRHKRGHGVGQIDIIDFPGGFVETGYQFPYWIKYTWEYWELAYVGMLASVGADLYVLKVGKYYEETAEVPVSPLLFQQWCSGFRFYL